MRVAVLEYLSGGGLDIASTSAPPASDLFAPLLREGLLMLSALAMDLVSCGHEVHICMADIATATKIGRDLIDHSPLLHAHGTNDDWLNGWTEIAAHCDCTILIAPEIEHELERIVATLREAGANVVASSDSFLKATSDKLATAKLMQAAQVRHPHTQTVAEASNRSFSFPTDSIVLGSAIHSTPLVLKRRDGAGCSDMKYFESERALDGWLRMNADSEWQAGDWIVQRWQSGIAASVAIIADPHWHLVGAMSQTICLEPQASELGHSETGIVQPSLANSSGATSCLEVHYHGGAGPLDCVSKEQLEAWLVRVRQALPLEALGWIGIDFVVPPVDSESTEFVLIEVNPRLTTSYLGYRQWYGPALSECLLGAADPTLLRSVDYRTMDRIAFEAN